MGAVARLQLRRSRQFLRDPRARRVPAVAAIALAAATVAAATGCQEANLSSGCAVDENCGEGFACTGRICIARTGGEEGFWVQLVPPARSTEARLDLQDVHFGPGEAILQLPARAGISIVIQSSDLDGIPTSPLEGRLRVGLALPASLPGFPVHRFQDDALGGFDGTQAQVRIAVPINRLGEVAALTVLPPPPLDRIVPPLATQVPLAADVSATMPRTSGVFVIEGNLNSAIKQPVVGYVATAWVAGNLVSNRAPTDVDGKFRLFVPLTHNAGPLEINLRPGAPTTAAPELTWIGFVPGQHSLADLRLPPFPGPKTLRIPVVGVDASGKAESVSGATARFSTIIAGAPAGQALYRHDTVSGFLPAPAGEILARLLPGDASTAQNYRVKVISPPGSPYATTCVDSYPVVGAGIGGEPLVGEPIKLPLRPLLQGFVRSADSEPVAGVSVSATRIPTGDRDACGDSAPTLLISTLTDRDGSFTLRVDPGLHRLEYRPPTNGTMAHRWEVLQIDRDTVHAAILPAGRVADGLVLGPGGAPSQRCEVRIYRPDPGGAAALMAHTFTGADGRFRTVVPAP